MERKTSHFHYWFPCLTTNLLKIKNAFFFRLHIVASCTSFCINDILVYNRTLKEDELEIHTWLRGEILDGAAIARISFDVWAKPTRIGAQPQRLEPSHRTSSKRKMLPHLSKNACAPSFVAMRAQVWTRLLPSILRSFAVLLVYIS